MSKPTTKVLCVRLGVLRWLRFEKRCAMVMHERQPWWSFGVPDVIGVTQRAQIIEVEIKIAMSDFRRDLHKRKHALGKRPYQFYFAVPDTIAEAVSKEMTLYPGAGLLSVAKHAHPQLLIKAETNKDSVKMDEHQWKRAVNCQANCVVSLTRQLLQASSMFGMTELDE